MDIRELAKKALKFRNDRKWAKYHTPKDSSMALVTEAAELLEHFKWHNEEEMKEYIVKHKKEIGEELSDVLFWVLVMANDLKIDLNKAFLNKLKRNELKYPLK